MRLAIAIVLAGLALNPLPAAASEMSVADLLDAPDTHDATEITLTGELVGDFQRRDKVVWTQLNDDAYATAPLHAGGSRAGTNMGVAAVFPAGSFDAAGFEHPGGYRFRGPVVKVTGTWHFHDEGRGGESYLVVEAFDLIDRERPIDQGGNWPALMIGLALVIGGLIPPLLRRRPGAGE